MNTIKLSNLQRSSKILKPYQFPEAADFQGMRVECGVQGTIKLELALDVNPMPETPTTSLDDDFGVYKFRPPGSLSTA